MASCPLSELPLDELLLEVFVQNDDSNKRALFIRTGTDRRFGLSEGECGLGLEPSPTIEIQSESNGSVRLPSIAAISRASSKRIGKACESAEKRARMRSQMESYISSCPKAL